VLIAGLTGGIGAVLTGGTFAAGAATAAIYATVAAGVGLVAQKFITKPSMRIGSALNRLHVSVDPQTEGKWIFGETAMATDIIYAEQVDTSAVQIIAAAAHRITSFGSLYINDDLISFSGNDATGDWADTLTRQTRTGTNSQTALSFMGAAATGKGMAFFSLEYTTGKTKTQNGIPNRVTQVGEGAPVYDPRLDSTRGGTGAHRADDQSTWEYTNGGVDIGANWALIVVFYLLGWRTEDGNLKLIFGVGADPDDIDWTSVIAAANVCDATVDSKPQYHIGGILPTDDEHAIVLRELEAAIGGKVGLVGGLYYLWAPSDDLTPVSSITDADLVDGVPVEYVPSGPIENLYNTARGRFVDPASLYQLVHYPEVAESAAVTEDGRSRVMAHDFSVVQDVDRAQRIARMLVRRSRFSGVYRFAVGPKGLTFKPFQVTTLNITETNSTDTTVRIVSMKYSLTGVVVMECVEEDETIYDTSDSLISQATEQDPSVSAAPVVTAANVAWSGVTDDGARPEDSATENLVNFTSGTPAGTLRDFWFDIDTGAGVYAHNGSSFVFGGDDTSNQNQGVDWLTNASALAKEGRRNINNLIENPGAETGTLPLTLAALGSYQPRKCEAAIGVLHTQSLAKPEKPRCF
jgi:hypothetical protein